MTDTNKEREDVELSRACVRAWETSGFTSNPMDAVHPMFNRAFELGYRASLSAEAEPVAEVVPCHTPSGKRVALRSEAQTLPIGTKLYLAAPAQAPAPGCEPTAEHALLQVLDVTRRYLPPDGPSAHDAMSEILAIVDPWPLGPLEK